MGEIKKMKNVKKCCLLVYWLQQVLSEPDVVSLIQVQEVQEVPQIVKLLQKKVRWKKPHKNLLRKKTLGTIGGIDLMADREFPKAGYFPAGAGSILGFEENKGELASCSYQRECTDKTSAEEIWHVEYSEDLEKIPGILKGLKGVWEDFLADGRMFYMYSAQQYEVIVDNTEKVTYNGVDFIKEEGHIDVTKKDPSDTDHPELVRGRYIAYYYFSPEGAGSNPADDLNGYGMGMAIWCLRPVDMSDEAEAKTMEENYEKLKKSTKASMETLISLDDYWKIHKKAY